MYLFDPGQPQFVHLDSQLEQVVKRLALGLCLGDVVTPDIAMAGSAIKSKGLIRTAKLERFNAYIPCLRTSTA